MEADKAYRNPTPVAVAIVPVEQNVKFKIDGIKQVDVIFQYVLYAQRNIEPQLGKFALPGGFVNEFERIETAGKRELFEETGLEIQEEEFQLFRSDMTPHNRVLVFGITPVRKTNILETLEYNISKIKHIQEETQGFAIGGINMHNTAFPLHQIAVEHYLNRANGSIVQFVNKTFGSKNAAALTEKLKSEGFLTENWKF